LKSTAASSEAPQSRREFRSATIRAIIVDDHPIVREGLKQIVTADPEITVCGEAATGEDALLIIAANQFDVAVLDLSLPDRNGLDVLTRIQCLRPDLPVLILSMEREDEFAVRALRAGASGYLEKRSAPERLVIAIKRLVQGHHYLSPELAERLIVNGRHRRAAEKPHDLLSPREFEVFIALGSGKGVGRIASELGLSVKTINNHRASVLAKLRVKTTADLIRYALRHDLVR
jgi:DNA-binding NarL/FixJ family response regulator